MGGNTILYIRYSIINNVLSYLEYRLSLRHTKLFKPIRKVLNNSAFGWF